MKQLLRCRAAVRFGLGCYRFVFHAREGNTNYVHFHFLNMPLTEEQRCQMVAAERIFIYPILEEFSFYRDASD